MTVMRSIAIVGCVAWMVVAARAECVPGDQSGPKGDDAASLPALPDTMNAPKRVRTVPVLPPPTERRPDADRPPDPSPQPRSVTVPSFPAEQGRIPSAPPPNAPTGPKPVRTITIRTDQGGQKRPERDPVSPFVRELGANVPAVECPPPVNPDAQRH
jgi:hypothetical protein